jgi:hypothetical protein
MEEALRGERLRADGLAEEVRGLQRRLDAARGAVEASLALEAGDGGWGRQVQISNNRTPATIPGIMPAAGDSAPGALGRMIPALRDSELEAQEHRLPELGATVRIAGDLIAQEHRDLEHRATELRATTNRAPMPVAGEPALLSGAERLAAQIDAACLPLRRKLELVIGERGSRLHA